MYDLSRKCVIHDSLLVHGRSGIRPADAKSVHPVFQHSPADAQHRRRVRLHIISTFQRIKNDLSLEFHDGLLEGEPSCQRVVSQ